jgi:hypothetical protein
MDDYFGKHHYGVQFKDGTIVDADEIDLETKEEKTSTKCLHSNQGFTCGCYKIAYNAGFEAGKKMKGSSWREGYIVGREELLADIMRMEQKLEALESQGGEGLTKN